MPTNRFGSQTPQNVVSPLKYKMAGAGATTVIESDTNKGIIGDYLKRLIIVPAVAACGTVALKDGATTLWTWTGGGTVALADLKPIPVEIDAQSVAGAWSLVVGASVVVMAIGDYS